MKLLFSGLLFIFPSLDCPPPPPPPRPACIFCEKGITVGGVQFYQNPFFLSRVLVFSFVVVNDNSINFSFG